MEHDSETIGGDSWLPLDCTIAGNSALSVSDARLNLWMLVLEARHVPFMVEPVSSGLRLYVPSGQYDTALRELTLFEEENLNWPPPPPPVTIRSQSVLLTLSILLLIASFHNITNLSLGLPGHEAIDWTALGSARAGDIARGEWWRAVTSLTLHTDVVHLCSNLFIGGFIILLLGQEVGAGFAWSMTVASGVVGNLINARVQLPTHVSVGASTALFGAIGVLTALGALRHTKIRRRLMLPVGAGLALLAALGTEGNHTDIGAHFFGFVSGAGFGVVAVVSGALEGRRRGLWSGVCAVGSAVLVLGAWLMAFGQW